MCNAKKVLILVLSIIMCAWNAVNYFVERPRLCMALLAGAHTSYYIAQEYSLLRYVTSNGIYARKALLSRILDCIILSLKH